MTKILSTSGHEREHEDSSVTRALMRSGRRSRARAPQPPSRGVHRGPSKYPRAAMRHSMWSAAPVRIPLEHNSTIRPCANFLYVLDAARTRAARAADTAPAQHSRLTLTCRPSRAAGRLARTAEHSGRFLTDDVHTTVAEPEHPTVPLADSRLARGPLAGPHDGQFRAGGEPPVRHHRLRGPAPAQVRNRPARTCR
jgi:hypothetical protein